MNMKTRATREKNRAGDRARQRQAEPSILITAETLHQDEGIKSSAGRR